MKRSVLLFFLPCIVFTLISYLFFQQSCDYAMSFQAQKKVPFNHESHVKRHGATSCETCHGYTENGRFKGIPTVGDCKVCHPDGSAVTMQYLKPYKNSDKPWESFAKQPDLVYFSHIAVLKNEKPAACSSCHGYKEESTGTEKIRGKMPMGECMRCHSALKISNKCTICHD